MSQIAQAPLLARRMTGGPYYHLTLGNPFGDSVLPGQFVMLSEGGVEEPFLKRPYSIYRALAPSPEEPAGRLELLIKIVGRGSRRTSLVPIGTMIELIGPLGRPFKIAETLSRALFVAGGVGVAPFVQLAAELSRRGIAATALIGGRTAGDLQAIDDLKALGVTLELASEDGTLGHHGRVTDLLAPWLEGGPRPGHELFVCGPEAMMKAVGRLALAAGWPCQLSLEATMGCGIGVCLGCVVKDEEGRFVRVCKEGPVREVRELLDYGQGDDHGV